MKIYLATDHAGFEMKENIKLFLEIEKDDILKEYNKNAIKNNILIESEIEIVDFGAYKYEEGDDYPKYISAAAGQISSDIYTGEKNNLAIIFGGSGEGEAMVADKYKGVRSGVINSENMELVKLLREHNNANVISFGARFLKEDFVKNAIKVFILTNFLEIENGEKSRHERRIEEITELENEIEIKETKISKEELEGLKELESLRKEVDDN